MALNTEFNLGADSDRLFNELLGAHDGLDREQSEQLNAGLILILMNHIGEPEVIREAIARARAALGRRQGGATGARGLRARCARAALGLR